jgi:hypothetical protein
MENKIQMLSLTLYVVYKQINLVTYLALTISCSCFNMTRKLCTYVLTPPGIFKDWSISLVGTCAYKSSIHGFMNSWIIKVHENQVMQFESILSCLCTAIVKVKVHENQVTQYEAYFYKFALQLSRYMKIKFF